LGGAPGHSIQVITGGEHISEGDYKSQRNHRVYQKIVGGGGLPSKEGDIRYIHPRE
jgi:hypothetical protein